MISQAGTYEIVTTERDNDWAQWPAATDEGGFDVVCLLPNSR
jgi:hypothetical protein